METKRHGRIWQDNDIYALIAEARGMGVSYRHGLPLEASLLRWVTMETLISHVQQKPFTRITYGLMKGSPHVHAWYQPQRREGNGKDNV